MTDIFMQAASKIDKYGKKYYDRPRSGLFRCAVSCLKIMLQMRRHKSHMRDDRWHIGIMFKGGIGDHVISAKYVVALKQYLGSKVVVDILAQQEDIDAIRGLFREQLVINDIVIWPRYKRNFRNYDMALSVCRYPEILAIDKKRLVKIGMFRVERYVRLLKKFAEDNFLALKYDVFGERLALAGGYKRDNQPDIDGLLRMDGVDFSPVCTKVVADVWAKFGLNGQYITLQCGGGSWLRGRKDVRQWPLENYEKLCVLLKAHYPRVCLVQLGDEKQPAIRGIDVDLRGKTDFEELKVLLQEAEIHIQQDGGMVHLRHVLTEKPNCVLFGPTDERFFGYEKDINIRAFDCSSCWGLGRKWQEKCLRSDGEPLCMTAILPEEVMKRIKDKLC